MYKLNEYGKIVVNDREVYYGCIIELTEKEVKLFVIDWRDRYHQPRQFAELIVPRGTFTIKYEQEVSQ